MGAFLVFSCENLPKEREQIVMKEKRFSERTIVFYNVENLFDTKDSPDTDDFDFTPNGFKQWDEERYHKKLKKITEALKMIPASPVLIGLAEIENSRVLKDWTKYLKKEGLNYKFIQYDSPDKRGMDVALLYDPDLFEVKTSKAIPVRLFNEPNFTTRDILYTHGELDGIETHVFVNHWSSRREGREETEYRRIRAAEILREKVDQILKKDPKANIFILGDFNDHPTDKSIENILRAKDSGEEDDLINLLYDEHEQGKGTSVHQREWAVLDQIIVSQAVYNDENRIGIKGKDAEILDDERLLYTYRDGGQKPNSTYGGKNYYGGYSDHLPVYVILK